jgi:putative tryptophan/tyrosine transport system substrate-binding protein
MSRRMFAALARTIARLLAVQPTQPGKMLRIALLAVLAFLGAAPVSHAQPSKTMPRLCFLGFSPYALGRQPWIDKFFQALRDLGYMDGRSIIIDYLSADSRNDRFPSLAAECLRRKADVIVPATTPAAQVARDATRTIPIVMLPLGDPVGTGLVESLARPGANVTGTTYMVTELAAKRLELLKEAVPGVSRVLVLTYLTDPIARLQVNAIKEASRSLGVTLQIHDIRTADDLPAAFDAAAGEGADGLIEAGATILIDNRARVNQLASRHRLPAIYGSPLFARDGGLMSFQADMGDLLRSSASYVDRVLKGAKPADLPVQRPTKFQLLVNLKTAKALGLTISPAFLARAEVIE